MYTDRILELMNTDVEVYGLRTEASCGTPYDEIESPHELMERCDVETSNQTYAELLLQHEEFQPVRVRVLRGEWRKKQEYPVMARDIPELDDYENVEIIGIEGTMPGRPNDVAEKLQALGIDAVTVIPRIDDDPPA